MDKTKASKTEINKIAARAKTTFNVPTECCILKVKSFKAMTGSSKSGGNYNYLQDRILINQNVAELRAFPYLEWTIFHEYGHAYFARTLARDSFFPMIIYAPTVEDAPIENGVRHMWNGLCDCLVNEIVLSKAGLKKFDPIVEETLCNISEELALGMCFHLYDYWKHGHNEQVAQKASEKIHPKIFMALQSKLSLTSLDNPINEMVDALAFIGGALFRLKVCRKAVLKQEIEKNAGVTLPKFWEDENRHIEVLEIA